ncbi:MAG: hypothetical protein NC177_01165 [Ruminococcus flavefaciens]|nr:hypothetical protein [Ruminococcus flavefaciens]
MKKLTSILMSVCMLTTVCSFTGCTSKDVPDEAVGTYSLDDVTITSNGKSLGITESDLSVCRSVEITDDGKVTCKGLAKNKKFTVSSCDKKSDFTTIYIQEAEDAGRDKKARLAQDYDVDKNYEGPSHITYYDDKVEVYFKFEGGTDAWYGVWHGSK